MNIASIDIGSNTVLLLIASVDNKTLKPIINKYESPRIGMGLSIGGKIKDDKISRLLEILSDYKKIADKYKCAKIIVTATNAMRVASNSNEIKNKIKEKLNLHVEIISGEREAEITYYGASSSMPGTDEKVVIDIGGGSTEIIYGNNLDILFKESFQIGVVSLTEMFLNDFPYENKLLKNANSYLQNIFSPIDSVIPKGIKIIAVAGTPTTLSCIKQNLKSYDEKKVERSIIDLNDINVIYKKIVLMSPEKIKHNFGSVVNGREDVIFGGLLILKHLTKVIKTNIINISSRGVRYGNIIKYINQLN